MAYRTLGELRAELSVRLGFGASGSAGINSALLNSFLSGAQGQLYEQFDWKALRRSEEISTGVAQTLYDWPADGNLERVLEVAVNDGVRWVPLTEGITLGMRSDATPQMPRRFERFEQMEVWPIPDAVYPVRREYVAALGRFTQDNDRASLDEGLIFLHALANAKQHYRQPDAQSYATQLAATLGRLKAKNRGASVVQRETADDAYLSRPVDV